MRLANIDPATLGHATPHAPGVSRWTSLRPQLWASQMGCRDGKREVPMGEPIWDL